MTEAEMVRAIKQDFNGDIGAYLKWLKRLPELRKREAADAARAQAAANAWRANVSGSRTDQKLRSSMRGRWHQMWRRCSDPKHRAYGNYGGRGIMVCERWASFDSYLADVGFPPATGMQLDRRDNNGDYTPENVRWATPAEQTRNRRP